MNPEKKIEDSHCVPETSPVENGQVSGTITHDAVFGAVTEDGPNYRGVCTGITLLLPLHLRKTNIVSLLGRLARCIRSYDEDPNRLRYPVHSRGI